MDLHGNQTTLLTDLMWLSKFQYLPNNIDGYLNIYMYICQYILGNESDKKELKKNIIITHGEPLAYQYV